MRTAKCYLLWWETQWETRWDPLFCSSITSTGHGGLMPGLPFDAVSSIVPKEEGTMGMGMLGMRDDEIESGSGSGYVEGVSCGEEHDTEAQLQQQQQHQHQHQHQPAGKKKRYHRHTARQIQEMETLFKECPHPDDKQRMKLSQELGLKPRQVKFWFQNRRTQVKAQQDRVDNVMLRAENESLKNDNFRLQAAMRNVICPNCGGPAMLGEMSLEEEHLRVENTRLKEELERLSCITSNFGSRPLQTLGPGPPLLLPSLDLGMGIYSGHLHEPVVATDMSSCTDLVSAATVPNNLPPFSGGMIIADQEKEMALDLAMTAVDHLRRMCRANEPLWIRRANGREVFDVEELQGGFRTEATRDSALVIMNSVTLVDALMDANKWMELFPSIVSKGKTVQIINRGISGHGSGSLHLMYGELQVLSPLVSAREAYFLRYCHQNAEEGTWTIVDFPADGFQNSLQISSAQYKRRPSGCVIQDMPNGYSRVMWVEHADVEDKPVHPTLQQYVNSGAAFGAARWLTVLQLQCERLASLMARNLSDLGVIPSPEARKKMMKLSQRMIRTFCASISSSDAQSWTALSDCADETIRVTTRKNTEPGQPNGVILTAVSTTWLPFDHEQVFDLLTDEHRRFQLDVISNGNSLHEVAHIAIGSHPKNCISLLRINAANNSSQNVELLLQESSTHQTGGSLMVYATIDVDAVQVAMSGEDTSYIPLLPMGFVILPAPSPSPVSNDTNNSNYAISFPTRDNDARPPGCLVTIGLQVLASAVPSAKLNLSSVAAIKNHLCNAVHQIRTALGGQSEPTALPPEQ